MQTLPKAHACLILGSESGESLGDVLNSIASYTCHQMLLKLGTDEFVTANDLTQGSSAFLMYESFLCRHIK